MAQVQEQLIVIKLSKLMKGNKETPLKAEILDEETVNSLEEVVASLVNDEGVIVEVVQE